jgi:hypothetical protein
MKTLATLKKIILISVISILSVLGTTTSLSCEPCKVLALADLTIPLIADAFDQYGNPIIDPNTGQTIQAINELFYNQRTGELFNYENPPSQGLLVGDVIQMATSVYNQFSESECELGGNAAPTGTDAKLNVSGSPYPEYNGVYQLNSMPTPQINYQQRGFTATAFQLLTPGYYSVNFNANRDRSITEHDFNNNFYVGDSGNYNRGNSSFSFVVEDAQNNKAGIDFIKLSLKDLAPKTIEEMKSMEIYRFITSDDYKHWILKNYK